MNYFPLRITDHYYLLKSINKPTDIANRIQGLDLEGGAIVNNNLSSSIQFIRAMEKVKKKWIIGSEFYFKEGPIICLAKNYNGWKELLDLTALANSENHYQKKLDRGIVTLDDLCDYKNLIFITGFPGTEIANACFSSLNAYLSKSYEEAKTYVNIDCKNKLNKVIGKYKAKLVNLYFGIDNNTPASKIITIALRHLSHTTKIKCVPINICLYLNKEDAEDHRAVLAIGHKTTLKNLLNEVKSQLDIDCVNALKCNQFYLKPNLEGFTAEEASNSFELANQCEIYNVFNDPIFPIFPCQNPNERLKQLCIEGWRKKIEGKIPKDQIEVYKERVRHELKVLTEAKLSSYFLVVQDYITAARNRGEMVFVRGSATGCLVSYLIGITNVDSIKYNLLFERFYNAGRATAGKISLPDIDADFPTNTRQNTIDDIKNKYGRDKVAQIVTYGRMQGRSIVKDILRVHGACDFETMNKITEKIPDEAKISDKLQEIKEETGEASIVRWALENNKEHFKGWCEIDEKHNLSGEFSKYFAQAIRLEGTKRNRGKHAAGLVVCAKPLKEVCPLIYDKSGEQIAALEMNDLELVGLVKMDVLGLGTLSRILSAKKLIETGNLD